MVSEHLPISLERYASLQARLDEGDTLAAVLVEEGLTESLWRSAQRGWLALLGAEVERKHYELAQRYQQAYLAARPQLSAVETAGRAHAHVGGQVPRLTAGGDLDGTGLALNLDLGDLALPFLTAGELAADPSFEPQPEEPPLPSEVPAAGATLEHETVSAAAPDERTAAAKMAPTGAETQFVSALSDADIMPFLDPSAAAAETAPAPSQHAPLQPTPPQPAPPPMPSQPAQATPVPQSVDATVAAEGLRLDLGDAIPFAGEAAAPAATAGSLPALSKSDLDGTAMVSGLLFEQAASPFDAQAAAVDEQAAAVDEQAAAVDEQAAAVDEPPVQLTLEQYASLCAECRVHPAAHGSINQKYGLQDVAARDRLDRHWSARMQADPQLRQSFDQLLPHYESWLRTR